MSSTPNTHTPSPSNIHPLASKVKASNNHGYRINWMSIQGCRDLQKIVCNNSCRSLLPPPSPHFCGLLLKRDVLQAKTCLKMNGRYDLKTHNVVWAEDVLVGTILCSLQVQCLHLYENLNACKGYNLHHCLHLRLPIK